jgi:hypothetical protein
LPTLRRVAATAFVGLALAGLATAATKPTVLRFTTVVRDSKPVGSDEPYWDVMKVGEIRAWIVPDAAAMTSWYYAFPTADQRSFDAVDWNTHFVFAATTKQRTSGFRLTIKRVSLQRVSRTVRQLCVIASLEKPRRGEPVVGRPYFSSHAVAMKSARFRIDEFHWAIPTRFVLRSPTGALLTESRAGGSLGRSVVTGKAKACTANIRISTSSVDRSRPSASAGRD